MGIALIESGCRLAAKHSANIRRFRSKNKFSSLFYPLLFSFSSSNLLKKASLLAFSSELCNNPHHYVKFVLKKASSKCSSLEKLSEYLNYPNT